jgi:methionyl aminopeptidase
MHHVQLKIEEEVGSITTLDVDKYVDALITEHGYKAAFKDVEGYEHATCVCLTDEVVHGVPKTNNSIRYGDIVTVDFAIRDEDGWIVDSADAFAIPDKNGGIVTGPNMPDYTMISDAYSILDAAIAACKKGKRATDVGKACEKKLLKLNTGGHGITLLPDFHGHGLLPNCLHAIPLIPSVKMSSIPTKDWEHQVARENYRFKEGDVVCVEPIIVPYDHHGFDIDEDGWTIRMRYQRSAIHVERCILITGKESEVLT